MIFTEQDLAEPVMPPVIGNWITAGFREMLLARLDIASEGRIQNLCNEIANFETQFGIRRGEC